jgi:hypothetical protein
MASETAKKIVNKEISAGDVTVDFCHLCTTFCKKDSSKSDSAPEYYI